MSDKKENNTKYEDFARNEIYAFHRLTLILSTFVLTVSFTLLTLEVKSNNACIQSVNMFVFSGVLIAGISNIIIVWWWLKKSLYKFYDRYDKHKYKRLSSEEKILCKKIKNHSKIWECIIRWTFYVCFSLFILFLVTSGVLSRFKDMIGS